MESHRPTWLYVGGGLTLLVMAVAFVLFILPSLLTQPPAAPTQAALAPASPPALSTTEDRAQSEALQKAALQQLVQAEAAGAARWGFEPNPVSFRDAQDALERANSLHDQRLYPQAIIAYRTTLDLFKQLHESRPGRLTSALAQSEAAYQSENVDLAIHSAKLAVLLDPNSSPAVSALARAQNLPKVLQALQSAQEREKADDLPAALTHYQTAFDLAPERQDLRETITRLQVEVDQRNYQEAVAQSLAALSRNDHRAASAALDKARRLRPNSPEVIEINARLHIARQTANLEALQRQATLLEQQEKWSEALATYERALKIDQMASFAGRGRSQAQQLVQLHQELDRYLGEPKRLYSAEPLAHAQSIAKQGQAFSNRGPQLQDKLKQLDHLIAMATTPVSVHLRSDQQTEVTIYRVGRLGSFNEREIALRPGTYTLVGTRAGYRDVRMDIDISPASNSPTISIQCVEAIK